MLHLATPARDSAIPLPIGKQVNRAGERRSRTKLSVRAWQNPSKECTAIVLRVVDIPQSATTVAAKLNIADLLPEAGQVGSNLDMLLHALIDSTYSTPV